MIFSDIPFRLYFCLEVAYRDHLHGDGTKRGELQCSLLCEKEDLTANAERESGRIRHERAAHLRRLPGKQGGTHVQRNKQDQSWNGKLVPINSLDDFPTLVCEVDL